MNKKLSTNEWEELIEAYYKSYSSITIKEFCKEQGISKQQFHYHKRKISDAKNSTNTVFQALSITSEEETVSHIIDNQAVNISIGKTIITIPASETLLISTIIKDLAMQC